MGFVQIYEKLWFFSVFWGSDLLSEGETLSRTIRGEISGLLKKQMLYSGIWRIFAYNIPNITSK